MKSKKENWSLWLRSAPECTAMRYSINSKINHFLFPLLTTLGITFSLSCESNSGKGVQIFSGAHVITMEKDNPNAEAVAIKDTEIIGVGNLKSLKLQFKGAIVDNRFT